MELIKPKINSVLKYHGGKNYLAKDIIPLLPDCEVFVDATVGAGNIILNLKPDQRRADYAIDIDPDIIRMWETLQVHYDEVLKLLKEVDYSEETFISSYMITSNSWINDIKWCANYIIKNRMSRGGLCKNFAWSERLRGGKPGDVNAWNNFIEVHYSRIIERIQSIMFFNGCMRDQLECLGVLDNPNAVVYIDPPYCKDTRTAKSVYKYEMEVLNADVIDSSKELTHEGILELISSSKCRFIISGYNNFLYNNISKYITRHIEFYTFNMPNNSGQTKIKTRRVECLWII